MHSPLRAIITRLFCRTLLFTHVGRRPRSSIVEGDLRIIIGVGPIQVDCGVYRRDTGVNIITSRSGRGVTPCDTSHDVAPTPDFSGSEDETKAQAPAQGPYLIIRWTDGTAGGEDRPGRRRTGLGDAISRPILRFVSPFFGYKRNFENRPSRVSRENLYLEVLEALFARNAMWYE